MVSSLFEFCDMYFCDRDGNTIYKMDNLTKAHIQYPEEENYKPVRRYEVSDEVIEKAKIGDYIKFEIVINGVDLNVEGDIVEINGNVIGIQ